MESLPKPFLQHHYPLLGVLNPNPSKSETEASGNASPTSSSSSDLAAQGIGLSPYSRSVRDQMVEYLGKYPLDSYWDTHNAKEVLKGFAIVTVHAGQSISSRLKYSPGQSLSSLESVLETAKTNHSALSPLNPESPLHPDGLMSPQWVLRQHQLYPSALISFHDLRYYTLAQGRRANGPDSGGDGPGSGTTDVLADDRIATDLLYNHKLAKLRKIKCIPIIILEQSDCERSDTDERIQRIRKVAQLESKSPLIVVRPVAPAQLEEQTAVLARTLLDHAMAYYREQVKRIKTKATRIAPQEFSMSTTDSPRITGKPPLSPAARAAAPGGGLAHPLSERASASAPNLPAVEALAATRSETKVIDPHGLPVLGWNLRYQFKMAVFSEFRQDIMTALQHYYATYTDLIEFMHQITQGTLVTLPSLKMFTRRWEEAKHFLDSLAWKMCKLYLYLDIPASSCELFNGHINSFSSLLASVGYGEGTSYYWKWMTAQHQNFAVLLEIGARHGLTFTLPRVVPVGNARLGASTASLPPNSSSVNLNASANTSTILALGAEFRLPTSFGLDRSVVSPAPLDETTPGCNPATVLQHPGFHYHAAALCSTQFRKRLQEELDHLAATKEAVDESSPTPTMVERLHEQNYLIPLQEKGATEPLFQTTINLLTHAYELFKKYRSVRHTLYMASEIAETYFEAGKYQTAAKFFERIAKTYRREQWGAILTSTLRWSLHCAIETEMWPTVIQLLVELLAPATVISGQERGEYQHELLRTLNAPVERAPTTTPAEPAVPDEGDESAPISRVQPIVVDMTTIYPFVTCFAQFRMDRLTLTGEGTPIRVPYQVVLVVAPGVLASPLRLDAVRLEFSQPQFNTEWTNSYPTWEATLEAEEDKNPSGKQHHVQHMANCTSQRWDTRSLTLPGVKAGERPFWRVEWQKMDSIGESSAPVSTNLWLQDHSYKVLQGELIVSHPRDLQFERIVAEIRTEHHVLALSYPFDDLATRNPPGAFTMGDDRYATKSTWWSTLARQEFGFDRFGQPKWLSVEASKEAKTPQPEEASNNDEADLPSEARNTGSCTLKWTRLPYTGFTHRLAVVDAPLPIEVSCNTGDGPILVHELFSGVIRVDNQSRRNVLIGARITLITADPLAHLADHPFDQVPPDERRSELDLSVTPVALPAGTQHRYQFAMGNFASPGTCQIKIQLQYQPMTADEDPTVSAEWAWSDEPADIQTTSHVYDWVVVEALILNFTGQSMTEPRRSSLASEPETAPSAPGSSPSPRPRMAIDHSSRTSVDSPRRYLLTGRLHNTAFWPIELSNLELLAPETPPGSIPTHPLSPTASSSSPRTSVVWSSFAQLHPRDASPTTAAAAVPDYVLVMPGQSVVHTFLVNTTVSVTSSGYSKRNSQAGKTLGMAQATWRRQLKVEDSVESGQPSGLVGGDPLPSTGSPLEELSRWNYTQFPVEVIGLSM
ncbi:hypothetical protein H4R33_004184 [Dimargaris cristalligena]|nr:hypothetical protein H4R33_004184 [Dimargaris cristalligena]